MPQPLQHVDGRILVVDDEDSIRWVLTRGLTRRGWKVESAANAQAALQQLSEQAYALVFLDVRLPDTDGLTLLQQIRLQPQPPMVIVMTAQGTVDTAISAMQRGAYEYIVKPFDLDDVVTLAHRPVAGVAVESAARRGVRAGWHDGKTSVGSEGGADGWRHSA
jgi:DNA-binding NtrC family response regulator